MTPGNAGGENQTPFFSVIIPTHQSRDYVVQALRRVLAQTDGDWEAIVLDNGSTDGTEQAVEAIGDPRIVYRWQEDSGLPADSRNKALELASGGFVAFLDADDEWLPEKLAKVRRALNTDLDVVCHDVSVVNPAGEVIGRRSYRLDARPVYEQLLYRGNFLTTSAMTVRREAIVGAGGFDVRADYFTVEDYDLWLRLAESGCKFALIGEVLGTYLVHPGGASSKLARHYDNYARVLDDHAEKAAREGTLDVFAVLGRRARARLAETRDLWRGKMYPEALRVSLRLPGEIVRAWSRYRKAGR